MRSLKHSNHLRMLCCGMLLGNSENFSYFFDYLGHEHLSFVRNDSRRRIGMFSYDVNDDLSAGSRLED